MRTLQEELWVIDSNARGLKGTRSKECERVEKLDVKEYKETTHGIKPSLAVREEDRSSSSDEEEMLSLKSTRTPRLRMANLYLYSTVAACFKQVLV